MRFRVQAFLVMVFLPIAAACKVGSVSSGDGMWSPAVNVTPERPILRAAPAAKQVAYARTTYDVCSNYFPAIELLKKALGSSASAPVECVPSSDPKVQRCQRSLRGCNVCAMLVDGSGPDLDWARTKCDGEYDPKTKGIHVCDHLCSGVPARAFASTLLHETIHRRQREGVGEIANDCQAYQAEEACFGTPFPPEAGFCFPIP